MPNIFPSLGKTWIQGTLAFSVRKGLSGPDPETTQAPAGKIAQWTASSQGNYWSIGGNFLVQVMESPTRGEVLLD